MLTANYVCLVRCTFQLQADSDVEEEAMEERRIHFVDLAYKIMGKEDQTKGVKPIAVRPV